MDTSGSFVCTCDPGFMGDGTVECVAITPSCATGGAATCVADSTCNDIPGGFECMCNSGFEGDGTIECTGKVYRQCHVYTIRLKLKPVSFRSV